MRAFGAFVVAVCLFAGTVRRAEPSPVRPTRSSILHEVHSGAHTAVLSHRTAATPRVSLPPFAAPAAGIVPVPPRAYALIAAPPLDDISDVRPPPPCARGPPIAR